MFLFTNRISSKLVSKHVNFLPFSRFFISIIIILMVETVTTDQQAGRAIGPKSGAPTQPLELHCDPNSVANLRTFECKMRGGCIESDKF